MNEKPEVCMTCNGNGEVDGIVEGTAGKVKCPKCNGSGSGGGTGIKPQAGPTPGPGGGTGE